MRSVILAALLTAAVSMPSSATAPLHVDAATFTPNEDAAFRKIAQRCTQDLIITLKAAKDSSIKTGIPMDYHFIMPDGSQLEVSSDVFIKYVLADCVRQRSLLDPDLQRPHAQQILQFLSSY